MRNFNNFIKMEMIEVAGSVFICGDSGVLQPAARFQRGKNFLKVIDFGCGMGGDVFKWFKNPQGLLFLAMPSLIYALTLGWRVPYKAWRLTLEQILLSTL